MAQFNKLLPYQQKDVLQGLLLDGLTYEQVEKIYGVTPDEIIGIINAKAVKPYKEQYTKEHENQDVLHKRTMWTWIKNGLYVAAGSYLFVVLIQSFLGGFESQILTDSIAYITQPAAKIVNLGIAVSFIVFALYQFFPILSTFINEKVNTTSLKETFLLAKPESKLHFLSMIVLALCLLVGLVFSAKGQTNKTRECVVQTAYKEIGVVETGGNNKGARIDNYRSVALGKTVKNYADAWCAYFIAYVYKSCRIPYKVSFSPRARCWFENNSTIVWRRNFQYGIVKPKPQKGDLIGYMFKAGNIGHIEMLYEWHEDEGYFLSIGGNTSNSNSVLRDANTSDGVRLKKRSISAAYIIANHIDHANI